MLIDGTNNDDTLVGASQGDRIIALDGDDLLVGDAGNDTIEGGSGNDVFFIGGTEFGEDIFDGGAGSDSIRVDAHIITDKFKLTSANLIGTEELDCNFRSIGGTNGNDIFDISGITTANG